MGLKSVLAPLGRAVVRVWSWVDSSRRFAFNLLWLILLVLIVTAAHAGFNPRARQIVAERGTPEQQAVCDQLWAGELRTEAQLRHYYDVMGPMYARRHDPAAAAATRTRGILSPEAINRAFAPGGFLQSIDLRPELGRITAPTLVLTSSDDPMRDEARAYAAKLSAAGVPVDFEVLGSATGWPGTLMASEPMECACAAVFQGRVQAFFAAHLPAKKTPA